MEPVKGERVSTIACRGRSGSSYNEGQYAAADMMRTTTVTLIGLQWSGVNNRQSTGD